MSQIRVNTIVDSQREELDTVKAQLTSVSEELATLKGTA